MVVSAPTGAGKTAIFELAIIRHLMQIRDTSSTMNTKVVYSTYVKLLHFSSSRFYGSIKGEPNW